MQRAAKRVQELGRAGELVFWAVLFHPQPREPRNEVQVPNAPRSLLDVRLGVIWRVLELVVTRAAQLAKNPRQLLPVSRIESGQARFESDIRFLTSVDKAPVEQIDGKIDGLLAKFQALVDP